jgi:DNA adenine methylase
VKRSSAKKQDPGLEADSRRGGAGKILCRPFVKWAGGKSQLLPELLRRMPQDAARYFEPFVGGGALLFASQPRFAVAVDINAELINAYRVVRDDVEILIEELSRHVYEKDHYYRIRNADRGAEYGGWSDARKAARLIYLNKSCYNGLYRVNSKGFFNTPFGRYTNPTLVDAANLRACSRVLQGVELRQGGFAEIEAELRTDDFVYFDPPYVPLSATASFTGYSREGFNLEMQKSLHQLCRRLDRRGVRFMLSNSSAEFITTLYKGFQVELVSAVRAVNSKAERRGGIKEVIVTNY